MDSTTDGLVPRQAEKDKKHQALRAFYAPLRRENVCPLGPVAAPASSACQARSDRGEGASETSALARPSTGAQAPLGNTAKSSSPSDLQDRARLKRAERFEGLAVARYWLYRHVQRVDPARNPGDVYRTHDCRYVRRQRQVEVKVSSETNVAHYAGLATCGSVWACPLCAAVIQQKRRVELTKLIQWAYASGYVPAMVTFTAPHTAFDSLADLRESMTDAFRRLRGGKAWAGFKARYGFDGLVRSTEVTYGQNGWHPHTHEIWLIKGMSEFDQVGFVQFVKERWAKVCMASGLLKSDDMIKRWHFGIHAVDVRFGITDSDYLAKQDASRAWGVDHEMASQSAKKAGPKGVHPHEFLIRREKGDGARFMEYIHAMKGASQLFWSRGLKAWVGIDDVDDNEAASDETPPDEVSRVLGAMSPEQWSLVRKLHKRAQLLEAAEIGGWDAVLSLLYSLGWSPYE